jgi:hypothetical protein
MRNSKEILVGEPEGIRQLDRPRRTLENGTKMHLRDHAGLLRACRRFSAGLR